MQFQGTRSQDHRAGRPGRRNQADRAAGVGLLLVFALLVGPAAGLAAVAG